jgi:hypothetical protein
MSGLSIGSAATLVAGLWALLAITQILASVYRRTVGRRRDRRARLARLGTGAQLSFFEAVLGEPPAMRRSFQQPDEAIVTQDDPRFDPRLVQPGESWHAVPETRSLIESIFIDRDYYVQTISDLDQTVLAFSVTSRSSRFRPRYDLPARPSLFERRRLRKKFNYRYVPLVSVVLGHSTFASLDPRDPAQFAGPHYKVSSGAHNWTYSEFHYLGNPGSYQSVVLTASDVAVHAAHGDAWKVQQELDGRQEWPDPVPTQYADQPAWGALSEAQRFRRETVITTYTVAHNLPLGDPAFTFGPQVNMVRTLP